MRECKYEKLLEYDTLRSSETDTETFRLVKFLRYDPEGYGNGSPRRSAVITQYDTICDAFAYLSGITIKL